jgi:hypothetical protein
MTLKYDKSIIMNATTVFHQLVNEFINYACLVVPMGTVNKDKEILLDRINNASTVEDETAESLKKSIEKTLDIMREIEYSRTGALEGLILRYKIMSEIPSILHISVAYPQSANARLSRLLRKLK